MPPMSKARKESRLLKMISFCCLFRRVALLGAAVFLTSCATNSSRQAAAADVELRFSGWDSVCIAKPDSRENGFATMYNASEVPERLARLNAGRTLAAVVVGLTYDENQVRDIGADWFSRLAPLGYQRVIVFRGSDQWPIAKLPIVYDSAISSGNDTRRVRDTHATTPSAARTDVAHPSVAAIR